MVDQPTAALLADLEQRGLLDETLVLFGSEFGRHADRPGRRTAATTTSPAIRCGWPGPA